MSENTKKTQITIDDTKYDFNDLTPEQQVLFQHCIDLDRKISNTAFQLDQLNVGKQAFYNMLKQALAYEPEVEVLPAVVQ